MKPPAKAKETQKTATDDKKPAKSNPKGKNKNEEPEEEPQGPPPEKPYNLERFIYITSYTDSNFMKILKQLFEEINQSAFKLRSVKEIYTRDLTEEERDNNEIDYISGFQLIDKTIRITILEGITGMAMKKIKETLPKTQTNSKNLMIFADSKVLFNKRIYSKFDLSLKYIKLRDNLSNILQTYDIYTKANKYKQIYDAFLNFGSILKAETMKEISTSELFPDAESLLLLERKYADILNDEDMTGIHKEKKKKRRIKGIDTMTKTSASGFSGKSSSKVLNESNSNSFDEKNSSIPKQKSFVSNKNSSKKSQEDEKINEKINKLGTKTLLDTRNMAFDDFLKERSEEKKKINHLIQNINYIKSMKRKPSTGKFCLPDTNYKYSDKFIMYGDSRSNHYSTITDRMREKYSKDKDHFYTYSLYGLTLNFPMIERDRNEEYLKYIENKKKWLKPEVDFERYKQPARDKVYFPKINNIL